MFEGLLKPKNYTKCKTNLKLIKTRLDTIRKKRNAVQKFLKKDLVDLLRNSLDYNAYGRAEGLLVEQNMSACYELIATFVACVSGHVSDICKLEDCPDECKEAIPSLIYAAARFSDLPELRDLRTFFTEKYRNSLEPYVNQEFIERLKQIPPSKEMKIQLLHELAQEFSIDWDRKGLEQRLYSPPISRQEKEKAKDDEEDDYDKMNPKMDDVWWSVQRSTDSETTMTDSSSQDDQKAACSSSLENAASDDHEEKAEEIKKPFTSKFAPPPPPYIREYNFESELKKSTSESPTAEKPKPRSVRRRPLKPPPNENTVKDFSKTGGAFEEMMVDELLMHYSQNQKQGKVQNTKRPVKSISQKEMTVVETLQGRGRSPSLVPEMSRTTTTTTTRKHVHPSLPEYEDFSARLAALRRTS